MKTLTCACGERVQVHDDTKSVRCTKCTMSGAVRLSDIEPRLIEIAAELGWPQNDTQRRELAWQLSSLFPPGRQPAIEQAILDALKRPTVRRTAANDIGGFILARCFETTPDGRTRPITDDTQEWRRVPLMTPPIDATTIPPWDDWELVPGPQTTPLTVRSKSHVRKQPRLGVQLGRHSVGAKLGASPRRLTPRTPRRSL